MGMGRVNPNTSSGMSGKGGAARPATPTAPQPGMGGKGVGQQPPQQVQPGMGGKGMGAGVGATNPLYDFPMINQPPQVQPGMGGKGVGQQPTYPFPQPPQVRPGMGGKGAGQPQGTLTGFGPTDAPIYSNDPNAVPYTGPSRGGVNFVNGVPATRPMQQPTIQPTPKPAPGSAQGMMPQQVGRLGGVPQPPMQTQQDLMAQRAAFDAANPQPVNNPNDPYAQRFGVPGNYVGTPAPQMPAPSIGALSGLSTPQPVRQPATQQAAQRALQQLAAKARR